MDVNKQLLDAAKAAVDHLKSAEEYVYADELQQAIAAAEQAQHGDHIVDATKMVQAEPVARDVLMALAEEVRSALTEQIAHKDEPWLASSEFDLAAIVDRYAAAPQTAPLSAALADIAAERRRQMEVEGWTPEHDDAYQEGHLADAAACYALFAHDTGASKGSIPAWWPWRNEWWKPTTARRNLVKAGALIAAEIERLDRAAQKGGAA